MDYYTLRKYYERDAAYLGLIKAFLQDCPQLILQLYILAVRDHESLDEPSIGTIRTCYCKSYYYFNVRISNRIISVAIISVIIALSLVGLK